MNSASTVPIGIAGYATYLPSGRLTSADLAERTGIPEPVLREKFGIHEKAKAAPDEHPSGMALRVAHACLQQTGLTGADLDAVIYFGSEYKDHYVWVLSTWLIEALGARRAFGFDMYAVCTGLIVALRTAIDMMRGNPALQNVLLVGASKESDLLDYGDQLSRFLFNFGDGAGAVLLRRAHSRHVVLSTDFVVDGRFSRCVQVPSVGTRALSETGHFGSTRKPAFVVHEPAKMKEELDPVSVSNFVRVIRGALQRAGCMPADVDFFGLLHAKRSYILSILDNLGIPENKAPYRWDTGHIQALDPLIALQRAEQNGQVREGSLVVLASAGAGYSWGAAVIRWGEMPR